MRAHSVKANMPIRLSKYFAVALAVLALGEVPRLYGLDVDAVSSQYTITSWTESEGLASSYIRAIAQDQSGYLWLATYSGLVRFDGVRFVQWNPRDGSLLPSEDLWALLIARDRSIWIGYGGLGGVSRIRGGEISNFKPSPGGLFESFVLALSEDSTGTVWAGGQGGLSYFNATTDSWQRVGPERGIPNQPVYSLHRDSAGTLWVGTGAGVFRRVVGSEMFKAVPAVSFRVDDFASSDPNALYVVDPGRGIVELAGSPVQEAAIARVQPADLRTARRLLRDHNGNLWIGTRGQGLLRVGRSRTGEPTVEHLKKEDGLSANSIFSIFEDREGNLWVGTPFGLNRLSENSILPVTFGLGDAGEARAVTAAGDGTIWAATSEGLIHFSNEGQTIYGRAEGLPSLNITALFSDDHTNTLWLSAEEGLFRIHTQASSRMHVLETLPFRRTRAITRDSDGHLWLCDSEKGVMRSRDRSSASFDVMAAGNASSIYSDRAGRVWIGFANGMVAQYANGSLRKFSEADGLPAGGVSVIYQDPRDGIWIGTHNGLSRFDNDHFVTIDRAHGLPGTGPVAMTNDSQGFFWLGVTGVGVVRIDPAEIAKTLSDPSHHLQYAVYDTSDGLHATPVRLAGSPTAARAGDGAIWFVTGNGLALVKPTQFRRNRVSAAELQIERIVANNNEYEFSSSLMLPPLLSQLQIDYTLLHLAPTPHVTFRYMLEGLNHEWVDAGSRRQAFYTNVPPGHYRFRVAVNSDGFWKESSQASELSVQPTFFQTGFFAGIMSVVVALMLWLLWQVRVRQMKARFALVLDERARMGREIHDTLLQGLIGVAVQFKVISEKVHATPDVAVARLERLRRRVEQYICETRESIWDLRSPNAARADLETELREAGQAITADQDVRFELIVSGKPRQCGQRIEENLLRVGQEALSNAVRHGKPNRVRVDLQYGQDTVGLRVVDDGCGFDLTMSKADSISHWGLAGMRERAQKVGGRFELSSAPGKGTQVNFVVPISTTS